MPALADRVAWLDAREWNGYARDINARTGRAMSEVCADLMALILRDAMRRTPPFGFGSSAYQVGRKAVADDVSRVFVGMNAGEMVDWEIINGPGAGNVGVRIVDPGGPFGRDVVYGVEQHLYRPHADNGTMEAHHNRYRDARGRVSKAGAWTYNVGRWKFVNRMHVPMSALMRYMGYKASHVGRAKAGWWGAFLHFSKRSGKVFAQPGAFVTKHGSQWSAATDTTPAGSDFGTMVAENLVGYAGQTSIGRELPRIVERHALSIRTGKYLERLRAALTKKSGRL